MKLLLYDFLRLVVISLIRSNIIIIRIIIIIIIIIIIPSPIKFRDSL
jgi:hypothetical protein